MSNNEFISRRRLLVQGAALGAATALPWSAHAAGYPDKTLEIVVPTRAICRVSR